MEQLPIRHLEARLDGAVLAVEGEVETIEPSPIPDGFSLRSPNYQLAVVRVASVLKGKCGERVNILFPTNPAPPWRTAPRLKEHQNAVFILRHLLVAGFPKGVKLSGSRSGYEVSVPSEELDYHPHSLGSGNVEITALAVHSNAFESETVRAICLAASDTGSPGAKAESELALDLQLHLAGALPRVSVEGTADRKRSAGPSGNLLYAHLQRLSQVASGRLFGLHFHWVGSGVAGT